MDPNLIIALIAAGIRYAIEAGGSVPSEEEIQAHLKTSLDKAIQASDELAKAAQDAQPK